MKNKIILSAILSAVMVVSCGSAPSYAPTSAIAQEVSSSLDTTLALSAVEPEVPEADVSLSAPEAVSEEANIVEERPFIHINFNFVGDVMLAEYKGQRTKNGFFDYYDAEGPEWFFDKVKHYFKEDDFTIVNVENVFTDNSSLTERLKDENPGYWYKAPTAYASILSEGYIEVATLNNNHVGDYGARGKNDTISALDNLSIKNGSYLRPCYFEKDNITIGMVCAGIWNDSQANQLSDLVKDVKQNCDICIVFFHGGEMMTYKPDSYKVKGAHNAIDAGADLVVGCHPHCLQPSEIYKDKVIVYSLGNFCYGGTKKPENRTVIFNWNVDVDPHSKEIIAEGYGFIPCYVYTGSSNNYQPAPIEDVDEREAVLSFMYGESDSPFVEDR